MWQEIELLISLPLPPQHQDCWYVELRWLMKSWGEKPAPCQLSYIPNLSLFSVWLLLIRYKHYWNTSAYDPLKRNLYIGSIPCSILVVANTFETNPWPVLSTACCKFPCFTACLYVYSVPSPHYHMQGTHLKVNVDLGMTVCA